MAYARRDFSGIAVKTTLGSGINNSDTSFTLASASGWPTVSNTGFFAVIDPDTSSEEVVFCAGRTGTSVTSVTRAQDGTSAVSHASGAEVWHIVGKTDADEANYTAAETVGKITAAGEILIGDGANSLAALDVKTSGRIIVGNGTTGVSVAVSGDATLSSAGAVTIANDAVTNAKAANMAADTIKGRANGAGTGDPTDLTATQVRTILDVPTNAEAILDALIAAKGDILVGTADNTPAVLTVGANDTVLMADSGETAGLKWAAPAAPAASAPGDAQATGSADTWSRSDHVHAREPEIIGFMIGRPDGAVLATGDGQGIVRVPAHLNGKNITGVAACVSTVSSSGVPTVQIGRTRAGVKVDVLSTRITIDANERDTSTAAAAAVINGSNDDLATADQLTIDVDVAGTGTKGLYVEITVGP